MGPGTACVGVDASTGPVLPVTVLKTSSAKNALGAPPALTVTSPVGGGVRNNPPAAVTSNAIALVVKSGLVAPLPQLLQFSPNAKSPKPSMWIEPALVLIKLNVA